MRFLLLLLLIIAAPTFAQERHYELTIDYQSVNYSGKPAEAMTINGQLPGPVLEFTEGDTAVIRVHNQLDTNASIHWHGLLLPQDQDGVPYLTFFLAQPLRIAFL